MDSTNATSLSSSTRQDRRGILIGGVALAAAVAGAGLAWWRHSPHEVASTGLDSLWTASFDTPQGSQLVMSAFRGKPLLVNFWATWCPPCVEELPLLDGFYRQHAANSWQVVGLAID